MSLIAFGPQEPRVQALRAGTRPWWDVVESRFVTAATLYLAQGCPDWGELPGAGKPILCTFCSLPHAAAGYRDEHFAGRQLTPEEHLGIFKANLEYVAPVSGEVHTVMVFNAGSFLAGSANHPDVQQGVVRMIAAHPTVKRLVIESRAALITPSALSDLIAVLNPAGKCLTVRIGIETQDDTLRNGVLRKGHSRVQLESAIAAMREAGVTSGGYVLLNPAPCLEFSWAREEALLTLRWVLGADAGGLAMDEAYFGPTCVGPGTLLEHAWRAGRFQPATLWETWWVLRQTIARHGRRIHLLPFRDEPPFEAVPSNHVSGGVPENLEGVSGCDMEFHRAFDEYRRTMDSDILVRPPTCSCRPEWSFAT